jgi:hypothetical protein
MSCPSASTTWRRRRCTPGMKRTFATFPCPGERRADPYRPDRTSTRISSAFPSCMPTGGQESISRVISNGSSPPSPPYSGGWGPLFSGSISSPIFPKSIIPSAVRGSGPFLALVRCLQKGSDPTPFRVSAVACGGKTAWQRSGSLYPGSGHPPRILRATLPTTMWCSPGAALPTARSAVPRVSGKDGSVSIPPTTFWTSWNACTARESVSSIFGRHLHPQAAAGAGDLQGNHRQGPADLVDGDIAGQPGRRRDPLCHAQSRLHPDQLWSGERLRKTAGLVQQTPRAEKPHPQGLSPDSTLRHTAAGLFHLWLPRRERCDHRRHALPDSGNPPFGRYFLYPRPVSRNGHLRSLQAARGGQ